MNECKAEVKEQLQPALEEENVKVVVIGELPGGDLVSAVADGMYEADLFVIMGTETYGKGTSGLIDTKKEMEMEHIISSKKPYFLFNNMNPEESLMRFKENITNMVMNLDTISWERWAVSSPMPTNKILHTTERRSAVHTALDQLGNFVDGGAWYRSRGTDSDADNQSGAPGGGTAAAVTLYMSINSADLVDSGYKGNTNAARVKTKGFF
jgi:hypothetical protein